MMKALIDYGGGGRATVWGNFTTKDQAKAAFYKCANDMFGIRKSIMDDKVLELVEADGLPEPWDKMEDATMVLSHNCGGSLGGLFTDTAVWNSKHEKIKSEWD